MTPARCLQDTPDQINSSNSTIRRRFGGPAGPHVSAVLASCAQAPSMPEGPAEGGVEAQRRALTAPSTAPKSNA
jgi:hypothetical protein